MSRAARSVFAFGIYVFLTGLAFLIIPATLVSLLGLPPATMGWARMIGLLALVIGSYDIVGGRAELTPYLRASVYVRIGFTIGVVLLVATKQMPISLLPLGIIDLLGACWTALALRADQRATTGGLRQADAAGNAG